MTMRSKTLLIVDDHALVREGLRLLLARLSGEWAFLEANSLASAEELLRDHTVDLVLLDALLPDGTGERSIERVRGLAPTTPVVIVSADEDVGRMRGALDVGARGYIPKSATPQVMIAALELVLTGGTYVPPEALSRSSTANGGLSPKQREVLALVVQGKGNKEIARTIGASESTVRAHLTNVFRALGVKNRTQAVQVALQRGIGG
jgi:DNA-binding NarL/FixJ family response regulator